MDYGSHTSMRRYKVSCNFPSRKMELMLILAVCLEVLENRFRLGTGGPVVFKFGSSK